MLLSKFIKELTKVDPNIISHLNKDDINIYRCNSINNADINELTFIESNNLISKIELCRASIIIIPNNNEIIKKINSKNKSYIISSNPKYSFAESLNIIHKKVSSNLVISQKAIIHKSAIIGDNCSIAANTFIGENVVIGSNNIIFPNSVISNNVRIGNKNIIHSNVTIEEESIIYNNCIFHPGCVIGADGFGFVPYKDRWKKMPQIGNVIIESDVEIGSNTCIDKPAVGSTIIGEGTKMDNLVEIGHGVVIGKNCAFAAQVGIAGGAKIGNNVILAGQVGINNRVKVGNNVIASSKCGIHCDVENGEIISGFPAIPNKSWLRSSALFKKLPELAKKIRNLEK